MMMSAGVFGTAERLGGHYYDRQRFEPSRNTQQPPPPPFDACERGRGWVVERNRGWMMDAGGGDGDDDRRLLKMGEGDMIGD
jgi:hypothetical protein